MIRCNFCAADGRGGGCRPTRSRESGGIEQIRTCRVRGQRDEIITGWDEATGCIGFALGFWVMVTKGDDGCCIALMSVIPLL